jgi:hypothetical protein
VLAVIVPSLTTLNIPETHENTPTTAHLDERLLAFDKRLTAPPRLHPLITLSMLRLIEMMEILSIQSAVGMNLIAFYSESLRKARCMLQKQNCFITT